MQHVRKHDQRPRSRSDVITLPRRMNLHADALRASSGDTLNAKKEAVATARKARPAASWREQLLSSTTDQHCPSP